MALTNAEKQNRWRPPVLETVYPDGRISWARLDPNPHAAIPEKPTEHAARQALAKKPTNAAIKDTRNAFLVEIMAAEDAEKKANRHRCRAARLLLDIRARVEAGELGKELATDWWAWYGTYFVQSRSLAEKLLKTVEGEASCYNAPR